MSYYFKLVLPIALLCFIPSLVLSKERSDDSITRKFPSSLKIHDCGKSSKCITIEIYNKSYNGICIFNSDLPFSTNSALGPPKTFHLKSAITGDYVKRKGFEIFHDQSLDSKITQSVLAVHYFQPRAKFIRTYKLDSWYQLSQSALYAMDVSIPVYDCDSLDLVSKPDFQVKVNYSEENK